MTVEETSAYLNVSQRTVYNLVKKGKLPVVHVGASLRFRKDAIDDHLIKKPHAARYILVIDDTPSVGELIKVMLKEEGCVVVSSTTGFEALEQIKEIKFDHIFLDMVMPEMDGLQILGNIRTIDPHIPVTIITGFPESAMLDEIRQLGISGVIVKPFTPAEVMAGLTREPVSTSQRIGVD